MNSNIEKFSFHTACKIVGNSVGWITHILENNDKSYSVMSHINCEHCDYCSDELNGIRVHKFKENPYEENQKRNALSEMKDFFRIFEKYNMIEEIGKIHEDGKIKMNYDDWCIFSNSSLYLIYLTYQLYKQPKEMI